MRCFEATGCGALLVTDDGRYPEGFVNEATMCTYSSTRQAVALLRRMLADPIRAREIASRGTSVINFVYGKDVQWRSFVALVGGL